MKVERSISVLRKEVEDKNRALAHLDHELSAMIKRFGLPRLKGTNRVLYQLSGLSIAREICQYQFRVIRVYNFYRTYMTMSIN